jgi:hypothetical protein
MKKIFFVIILLMAFCSNGLAATYYVSTTGNDSSGDGSINSPWLTPAYGASQLTSAGDILYIRAGTYNVTTSTDTRSVAIYPRANNCRIAAYNGESVTLQGSSTGNYGESPTNGVIGTDSTSGLVIDGFNIQGIVMFDGCGSGTVQNCDISVGVDSWNGIGQGEVIWIEDATNVSIINNKIHDNSWGGESGTIQNNGLIMCYTVNGLIIENNDFYNSAGTGITMKDDLQNATIRYNHIYDNAAAGIWTGNNTANSYSNSANIYQNIIRNNNTTNNSEMGGIALVVETSNLNIYNNTFYQNYVADLLQWTSGNSVPFTFFNNISSNPRASHLSWPYGGSTMAATYLDFNDYYNDVQWRLYGVNYSTINTWRDAIQAVLSGADDSSVTTDPSFSNSSGNMDEPEDFKRTSYPAIGRGGSYESVMGAWISDSSPTQIGYSVGGSETPATPATISYGTLQRGIFVGGD